MGAAGSKLEKALGDQFLLSQRAEGERYFKLKNLATLISVKVLYRFGSIVHCLIFFNYFMYFGHVLW
ncbi:hypothetical protein GIB67_006274 [Kingdonia uniflora]|uniref:Uncharacterized protein n=1 Tax=Kingdonia uniflora TaxID=39325 RepID=A0A7J7P5S9_9MAGN|nr:hypothetical protein GIB67_006274 [Kingdonia uniflora]